MDVNSDWGFHTLLRSVLFQALHRPAAVGACSGGAGGGGGDNGPVTVSTSGCRLWFGLFG